MLVLASKTFTEKTEPSTGFNNRQPPLPCDGQSWVGGPVALMSGGRIASCSASPPGLTKTRASGGSDDGGVAVAVGVLVDVDVGVHVGVSGGVFVAVGVAV